MMSKSKVRSGITGSRRKSVGRCFLLTALFAVLSASSLRAADTTTRIFNPSFRSMKISRPDAFMAPPVITLGTGEHLTLSFDEIGEDISDLQFRLIHCNNDWQPSALLESEYLDGFNIADIEDAAFSQNTFVHFVNYRVEIPAPGMEPLASGNYLVQVFFRDDPETPVLQARFYVTEQAVRIFGNASGRTDRGINTDWQQLNLRIDPGSFPLSNPFSDVKLAVSRNDSPETERMIPVPSRLEGKTMIYEHVPSLVYPASNEYRRFETVRVNYPGIHVDSMRYGGSNYHAYLGRDYQRAGRSYQYDETQHGRFLVHEFNSTDPDLGADYVTVHFTLDTPELIGADVYIDGEMTHHRLDETTRMVFDHNDRLYRLQIPLKQGSYNYRYVAVPTDRPEWSRASSSPIEGDYSDTSNEYLVRAYYRPPGSRADRLISVATILSEK